MANQEPFLKVRFEGEAVGPGKIPVSHLMKFLTNFKNAIQRTRNVLHGDKISVHRGRQPRSTLEEVELNLVSLTEGSPEAVLGFERRQPLKPTAELIQTIDFGPEIIEKAIAGLEQIQVQGDELPEGCDAGVLMAWKAVGGLFLQGVDSIQFTLNHRQPSLKISFTPQGFNRIQERIRGPQTNIRTNEGRLLMADFKEHGTRCRVHPAFGDPIFCLFDDEQKDEVLENILHFVRIVGEACEDPVTGKISTIKIHDIERLEEMEYEATDLLPQGTPISRSFWESPTLDELAAMQNVKPVVDVESLLGGWPGDVDDGFEEEILKIRHQDIVGGRF